MEFEVKQPQYIIGIDLGTTNTIVAYTKCMYQNSLEQGGTSDYLEGPERKGKGINSEGEEQYPDIRLFRILQFTDRKMLEKREGLPSFLYIKRDEEIDDSGFNLPWEKSNPLIVGEMAAKRGIELPHRLVSSSKSWLCNKNVDREDSILPFDMTNSQVGSPNTDSLKKISPVDAACAILSHIKNAWNYEIAEDDPLLKFENQEIYLTVPASFDAIARQLTVKAAELAGLGSPVLIEEPQAAFYSWINSAKDKWRTSVKKGDLILVCDIGGGTSDFSLIEVKEGKNGNLELERLAVGDHLLVGGDNIDLALTYFIRAELEKKGKKIDDWQMRALIHSSRKAKESLCSGEGKDKYPVTILGRGRGLIKGTIKTKLYYKDIEAILFDGFFPLCRISDRPHRPTNTGIKEFGLAYESDPGITRHLAKFISSCVDENGKIRLPTAVVFNGGVMKSPLLRKRVMDIIRSWVDECRGDEACAAGVNDRVREIEGVDFDFSVAKGAAYYGLAVKGRGIRIRAGLGKSYYMAVEASMPAVPGFIPPTRALCIAPFGMEEGSEALCSDRIFNLVVGHEVNFDIMTSSVRRNDILGAMIDNWQEKGIKELSSIGSVLEGDSNVMVPVNFKVKLTETGSLEFWAYEIDGKRKWKFEFNIRNTSA